MKIIGNTVGMGLPKPNLMQTEPSKGDYVYGSSIIVKTANGIAPDKNGNVEISDSYPEDYDIARYTDGHFKQIHVTRNRSMKVYVVTEVVDDVETIEERETPIIGSDYIPCPKNLCISYSSGARCYLYFYRKDATGAYVPVWDVLSYTTSGKVKNYIAVGEGGLIRNIPDGTFLQVSTAIGTVKLYGWDGEPFGIPVCGDSTIVTTSNEYGALNKSGYGSVIVPGSARFVIAHDRKIALRVTSGVKDGVSTILFTNVVNMRELPTGYDYFVIRVDTEYNTGIKISPMGDMSEYVSVVCDASCVRRSETRAKKVIEAAKTICNLQWTPIVDIQTHDNQSKFKAGVKYNGLPYGEGWSYAHFIGWHVSPHTFVNAANDADSIFFKGRTDTAEGPFYSIVCSAFATMAAGWPYPGSNAAFVINPRMEYFRTVVPQIGSVWSNMDNSIDTLHCVIPERVDYIGSDVEAISAYEAVKPLSMRTIRYSNISSTEDKSTFDAAAGETYYNRYGIAAYHLDAVSDMSNIPYGDFTDTAIVGGDARPYRGDKSTYTSVMSDVLINIKNGATKLYLKNSSGAIQTIDVTGRNQIDVKSYLTASGIYYVYTNTSNVQESFEYVICEPLTYTITNGKISFSRNDFWYAYGRFKCGPQNPYRPNQTTVINVPSNSKGDYSDWESGGTFTSIDVAFYKGTYGAYVIPVTAK